jgi:pimeloyl-ACP methyl ester carboxylesterase
MSDLIHRDIAANGISIHVTELGTGPLVVLCHGFPETSYSWRHQIGVLAEAGFRVVAPDMRGFGRSEQPWEVGKYTTFDLVGDMVGLVNALGETTAVITGHDVGARVAWHAALFRPDIFRAIIALSVPYVPRSPTRPTLSMPRDGKRMFYQLYYQDEGIAEADMSKDIRRTIRSILYSSSGEGVSAFEACGKKFESPLVDPEVGMIAARPNPQTLPKWLQESDIDIYVEAYSRTGFRSPLNWYRTVDENWRLLAPWAGAKVVVPALYIAGTSDLVVRFRGMDQLIPNLRLHVPQLVKTVMLDGCGHWTQQERPSEVNAEILDFLAKI